MAVKYMMATKAIHLLGDISSDEPDLCEIHSEDNENYIGNWVTGAGFIDVKFPKATTRELTEEERQRFHGKMVGIPGSWHYQIDIQPEHKIDTPPAVEAISVPAFAIPKGAKLVECYETEHEYVICGEVNDADESHNCDEMGCGTLSHVVARFGKEKKS